jgi:hypothetical protein
MVSITVILRGWVAYSFRPCIRLVLGMTSLSRHNLNNFSVALSDPVEWRLLLKIAATHSGSSLELWNLFSGRPCRWTLSRARWIQSTFSHLILLRSVLISSSHLRSGLSSGLFPSSFQIIILCAFLTFLLTATCRYFVFLRKCSKNVFGPGSIIAPLSPEVTITLSCSSFPINVVDTFWNECEMGCSTMKLCWWLATVPRNLFSPSLGLNMWKWKSSVKLRKYGSRWGDKSFRHSETGGIMCVVRYQSVISRQG